LYGKIFLGRDLLALDLVLSGREEDAVVDVVDSLLCDWPSSWGMWLGDDVESGRSCSAISSASHLPSLPSRSGSRLDRSYMPPYRVTKMQTAISTVRYVTVSGPPRL
jgi:hypothetical protein